MIDIQSILGEYTVLANGAPNMAWIVSALILLMFIWFVGAGIMHLLKAILK